MRVVAWRALLYEQIIRWHFSMGQMEKSKWGKKKLRRALSRRQDLRHSGPDWRGRRNPPSLAYVVRYWCTVKPTNLQTLPHGVGF